MKIDYHIHSRYSADSSLDMPSLISQALKLSYTEVAFTDHFDLIPSEIAVYGIPSYLRYSEAIAIQKNLNPHLSILKGVELGEYHRCYDLVNEVLKSHSAPDIKIASIHVLPDGKNLSEPLTIDITPDIITSYYQENLTLAQRGNFDILGHLGIYKRYLPQEPDETTVFEIIKEIFRQIINQDIALEINLSGLRNSYGKLIPAPEYLQLYRQMGGKLITIGSDSHKIEHFDSHYEIAVKEIISCGFTQTARKTDTGWSLEKFMV